jgi:hypothetical protein
MKRYKIFANGVIAASILLLFQNCATIFGGRTHTLVFESIDDGQAEVYIDDELVGSAPGKITLPKGTIQHGSTLEIRADGTATNEYLILLKPHAGYIIADFVVGAIPLIFDFATGDILRPKPRKFIIDPKAEAEHSKSDSK